MSSREDSPVAVRTTGSHPTEAAESTASAGRRAAARLAAERGSRGRIGDARLAAAEPPFPLGIAALVYAVATLLLGYQALGGGFLVNPMSDQYIAGYAFREFGASWLRQTGGFPLWNPYLFGGMPYVAAMHGDIFYPTFVLRMLMPTDAAMTWGFIIHVFLAGLFTYGFLRRVGLSFFPALVGGLAYMVGGNVAGLVSPGHDGKLYIAALLPLVLLFTYRAVRDARFWAYGALALTVTLAVLTPHPQLLQYLLLVCGAWAVFLAFSADATGARLDRRSAVIRLGGALGAVVLGLLGGAIQFAPVFQYAPWSPRAGGKGWEHAISYSMPPEELINTYLPQFSGLLERYTGRNVIHFHSEYIGAAVLVLAGLAFGAGAARRRLTLFWGITLLVAVLWALGGFTPFYHLVYALVPGTKYFRAPSTMLYVVQFATAMLAAIGTERALEGRAGTKYAIGWVVAGLVIAFLATSGALTNLAASVADPRLAPNAEANRGAVMLGGWRSFLAVAATVGVLLGVARGAIRASVAGWALAAIVALDLWSIERLYWRFSAPAAQLYATNPAIEYLSHLAEPGRVATLALQDGLPVAPHDPDLSGDGLMVHRVRQVEGYHGNELGRYQQLYGADTGQPQIVNPAFWRLTNLQFVLTNLAELPLEGATKVLGPVKDAAGSTVFLYRLPGSNPAAWVTPLGVKASDASTLATVLDPRFDAARVALFDSASTVATQPVPQQLPAALDLKVLFRRWDPGHISLELDRPAPAGASLVVSENYYPGWRARVDGRDASIARADYSLIGVPLPTGSRQIELTFDSPVYHTGKTITLVALAVAGLLTLAGLAVDRRRVRG
ncbi:Protein of unknown function, membrane YfhO [Gemmatirosa kalamazoonensis]|uniref:Bacterial membrane protein YfhO n=1 Tax=Gemmatirosa kalamazoonensis TaxID=861299 RepID=W0RMY0_9BACT|nr:YfhO family protein [Gemmatirosa kalamazoonensis]AHG90783.1 Protein of unknown function, membrane YfhO [Gemmatirosa kalamazoonensis]